MDGTLAEPLKPIVKGEGATRSERILGKLGKASFLDLWTYPSPHRDKKLRGAGDGKEICDLLVVCGDDVIVFSDKEIAWSDHADRDVAWGRWYRAAVRDSVKQIRGAENHLRRRPEDVYLDKECTVGLPIALPPAERMRVHGIVVATGAERACRATTGNRGGRLVVDGRIRGDAHLRPDAEAYQPFAVGDVDPSGSFVHVFDRPGMVAVLTLLDTISDFVRYLRKREEAIRGGVVAFAFGEDDMVAHYVAGTGRDGDHDFLRRDGDRGYAIADGAAEMLKTNAAFRTKLADDEVSYAWDKLIEIVSGHVLARTDVTFVGERPSVRQAEEGLRLMAIEPRTIRRVLSQRVLDSIRSLVDNGADRNAAMFMHPPEHERCNGFVMLVMANHDRHFDGDEDLYRRYRLLVGTIYARVLLEANRYLTSVTVIGLDAPDFVTGKRGGSQDIATHYQIDWTEGDLAQLRRQQQEQGILVDYRGGGRRYQAFEYRGEETRQQRRARERDGRKKRKGR